MLLLERTNTVYLAGSIVKWWLSEGKHPVSDGCSVYLWNQVYSEVSNLRGYLMNLLEGAEVGDKKLHLGWSKIREIEAAILSDLGIHKPSFFEERRPVGLQTKTGFWVAEQGKIKKIPSSPTHRQTHSYPDLERGEPEAWLAFLRQIWADEDDSEEKIKCLQAFLGACLTQAPLSRALLLTGAGANGKSALLRCLSTIIGPELSSSISPDNMTRHNSEYYVYQLKDARFNFAGELNKDSLKRDTASLKSVIGQDPIVGRKAYSMPIRFTPRCGHAFSSNHTIEFHDNSYGWERRFAILTFNQKFSGSKAKSFDKLWAPIKEDLGKIYAWALEGACYVLSNQDLPVPQSSQDEIKLIVMDNPINDFLLNAAIIGGNSDTRSTDVYKAFQQFIDMRGHDETLWTHKKFSSQIVEALSRYTSTPKRRTAAGVTFNLILKDRMSWASIN